MYQGSQFRERSLNVLDINFSVEFTGEMVKIQLRTCSESQIHTRTSTISSM